MTPNSLVQVHIFISGKVQGVFFRADTIKKAQDLKISGWVRNLADGRVETMIIGPKDKTNQMITWLKQGSRLAAVDKVEIISRKEVKTDPFNKVFCQLPTAQKPATLQGKCFSQ